MEMSPEINELAGALAKAQTTLANASKDANNPFFKSKYATLASVWDAWQAVGPANGLAVAQAVDGEEGERDTLYAVTTLLTHSSGQWIKSITPILLGKKDMQNLGSACTYARRYSLSAMVGISPEDDDGNEAAKSPQTKSAPAKQQKPKEDNYPSPADMAKKDAKLIGDSIEACLTREELDSFWKTDKTEGRVTMIAQYSEVAPSDLRARYNSRRRLLTEKPAL